MKSFLAILCIGLSACSNLQTSADPDAPASFLTEKTRPGIPADGSFGIDLKTTLQLAAGRNLSLAAAIEKANSAAAQSDRAMFSIIPDLAVGASFAKQNGLLQDIAGDPLDTKRVSDSSGLGTNSGIPGIGLDLSLSHAIFSPLAARQDRKASAAAAEAKQHQILADAAAAYYELVRARAAVQLAREIEGAARKLASSTRDFADAGEGLEADAERAAATHLLRQGQTARTEADLIRRSAALSRILHLPVSITLIPTDPSAAATHLVNPDESVARMVATALKFRPETRQMQAEVIAAGHRLTEKKVKPFLPSIAAGYSNYEFAAGRGGAPDADGPREEVTAMVYWKLEGLGFGDAAQARAKQSELKLARLREADLLDSIASDVAGYRAELIAQRARLSIGHQAASHAKKSYELTAARLQQAQGLPIEALASIQTLAEARQAEIDAVLDYNIAQHRLLAALGHPN